MDLIRLNPETWYPEKDVITNYETLIWTERFAGISEFELESYAVSELMALLPIWTPVSLVQSEEVMLVEEHIIKTDAEGIETIKIKGKSMTSYLHHRTIGELQGVQYETAQSYYPLDIGLVVLYNSFVNGQAWDITRNIAASYKDPKDKIPNLSITDSTTKAQVGINTKRYISPGYIYDPIYAWFRAGDYGLRTYRPPHTAKKVSVTNAGLISKTMTENITDLCLDVYHGTDRTTKLFTKTPVILDIERDDLILPNYYFSISNFKNSGHIVLDNKTIFVSSKQSPAPGELAPDKLSGVRRRVRFFEAGRPEEGSDLAAFESEVSKAAIESMKSNYRDYMVDGELSSQSEWKFGRDFFLGDLIHIRGRYGALSKGLVTEFIRSETQDWENSYPSITIV